MVAFQVDPDELQDACGDDPTWMCREVFEVTDSELAAATANAVFGPLGRIVLVLVVAFAANRLARRAITRFGNQISLGDSLRAAARSKTLMQVLQSVATVLIWTIALITILGELDLNLGPLVASAGIAGVALGFGAQSLVKDVLSGFFMLVEDQFGVGDIVDLGEASGTVEAVSLRTTRLRDVEGNLWHVPNGTILRVANKSQDWSRAVLDVHVAYGTDVERAIEVIKQTADELRADPAWKDTILEPADVWGIEQLASDAIHIRLVVKTRPAEQFKVTRELRRRLLRSFGDDGIEVPTGQQTVWLRESPPSPDAS